MTENIFDLTDVSDIPAEISTDLSEEVYKVFGSDDDRLIKKVQAIFSDSVTAFFDKVSKSYWEVA